MFENEFYISQLIAGHFRGQLSAEQQAVLNAWLETSMSNRAYFDTLADENLLRAKLKRFNTANKIKIWDKTRNKIKNAVEANDQPVKKEIRKLWPKIIAAASIVLILGVGFYFYRSVILSLSKNNAVLLNLSKHDIQAGGNKATLMLANGRKISLTDAKNGDIANENNTVISKTADGQIIYNSKSGSGTSLVYNTMVTPRGGQYTLTLSDGTKVILNAASSLKYPISFRGSERKVELVGEAYFIVKHNAKQPFRVKTKGQIVEDIGTEFNINAYADESTTKTTLIEGAARVVAGVTLSLSKGVLRQAQHDTGQAQGEIGQDQSNTGQAQHDAVLKPGQQSLLTSNGNLKVASVNVEEAIAWKNGKFRFVNTDLEVVLRQLGRWYDVNIQYIGKVPDRKFTGWIDRKLSASEALGILKYMKVNFEIKGKTIIVSQ